MVDNKFIPGSAADALLGDGSNALLGGVAALSTPASATPSGNALQGLAALGSPMPLLPPTNSLGVSSLFGVPYDPLAPSAALGGLNTVNWLAVASETYRRRKEWEDRFAHWERRESDAESLRIERARGMVQAALERDPWLRAQRAVIVPQGSFTNRTNTRLEADIDLRVQFPLLKIEYGPGVDPQLGWSQGG